MEVPGRQAGTGGKDGLLVAADPGRVLKEWYGACAGTTAPTCTLTLKGNVQLGAKFRNPDPK